MGIGTFLASMLSGGTSALTAVTNNMVALGCAFQNVSVWQGMYQVVVQSAGFLWNVASLIISCVTWQFWFFNNFPWLQSILTAINVAIVLKIIYDLYRLAKPFGT